MSAGEGLEVFDTAFGTIAMLTCYDIEFPEIVRMARAKGADVVFVLPVRTIVMGSIESDIAVMPELSKIKCIL